MLRALSVLLFVSLFSGNLAAQQTTIPNYESARDNFFWPELYADGGESVYCAIPFDAGERLTVEHAYPADWIAEGVGFLLPPLLLCPEMSNLLNLLHKPVCIEKGCLPERCD